MAVDTQPFQNVSEKKPSRNYDCVAGKPEYYNEDRGDHLDPEKNSPYGDY
jgi:hypothetical protein